MAVVFHHSAVSILEIELQSAELGTLTTVGTSSKTILRGIACTRVAHTKCSMHEHLQFNIGHSLMDGTNLLQRQFPGKHDSGEAHITKLPHPLYRPVVGLR